MAGKKKRRKPRRRKSPARRRRLRTLAGILVTLAVLAAGFVLHLYVEITTTFESRVWTAPSTIHSAPLVLNRGSRVAPDVLAKRLERCGYGRVSADPGSPGQYRLDGSFLDVFLRALDAPSLDLPSRYRTLGFRGGILRSIRDRQGRRHSRVWFEPERLATLYGPSREEREVLPYDRFPERFVRAVLAAEDGRFFSHRGVDLRAIARAALANLRNRRIVQGGSTIPQQTVKNLFLGHQRTWWRKLREIPMALVLDLRYPKERILEVYLNEVYLGQRRSVSICGAQAASRFYFGRDLVDLSLGESAMLAGMIRNPGGCNPFANPDRAVQRRGQVLDAMVELEWLEKVEADRARREPLSLGSGEGGYARARYVVDLVRQDLERYYPSRVLQEEGLQVFTTLNTVLQDTAADALRTGLERLDGLGRGAEGKRLQGCVLVTEPTTGAILALVGGREYRRTQFNRVVQARRQPGSCFKPFVYLTALEEAERSDSRGLTLASILDDSPLEMTLGGKRWRPSNHDRRFRGEVTVRQALEESLNVPTVRAADRVGIDRIIRTAERCGIESALRPYPSLALGSQEVTPLELATAYGTLAAGGVRAEPRIIGEVRNHRGTRLERRTVERTRAVGPRSAWLVTDALQGVLRSGTARSARAYGYTGEAAGKTGTTDDNRDAWFVGYHTDVLALVWVGYDDNSRTGLSGASGALPIWVEVMQAAEAYRPPRPGYRPDGIRRFRIDPGTGKLAVGGCPEVVVEWFAGGTEPDGECTLHGGKGIRNWFRRWFKRDRARTD